MAEIYRISGPVVTAEGLKARMYDVVKVGEDKLIGEVIQIRPTRTVIQVYEDTTGIKPGEPVENTGSPLTVELGPGLLKNIYDGIQRPLPFLKAMTGDFIGRGAYTDALDRKKQWAFTPSVKKGGEVEEGAVIGTVRETEIIEHRELVPYGMRGKIKEIREGKFTVADTVAVLESGEEIKLM